MSDVRPRSEPTDIATPTEDGMIRIRTSPDPNPAYLEFLERTRDWDDAFAVPGPTTD